MKKLFFCIFTLAIVSLAAFNLNLVFNKESKINFSFSSIFSLAQSELPQTDGCRTSCSVVELPSLCAFYVTYSCLAGFEKECRVGNE